MTHIPYKSSPPQITDMLSGTAPLGFVQIATAAPHLRAGKLLAYATTGDKRAPQLPDLPTVAEQGYPEYESYTWYAMFAPPGLSRELTLRLNAILNEALAKPDIVKTFTAQGAEPAGGTPEDLARLVRSDYERWRKVVVTAKIQSD